MTVTLPRSAATARRVAGAGAAGAAALSALATTTSFAWLPLDSAAVAVVVALILHATLLLTIVDSHDRRLRGAAIAVGTLLAGFLVAGSLWTAVTHFPGQPPAILVCLVENTAGPLTVLAVHNGRVVSRPRRSVRR